MNTWLPRKNVLSIIFNLKVLISWKKYVNPIFCPMHMNKRRRGLKAFSTLSKGCIFHDWTSFSTCAHNWRPHVQCTWVKTCVGIPPAHKTFAWFLHLQNKTFVFCKFIPDSYFHSLRRKTQATTALIQKLLKMCSVTSVYIWIRP